MSSDRFRNDLAVQAHDEQAERDETWDEEWEAGMDAADAAWSGRGWEA